MSEASSTSVLLSVNNQENQLDNTDNDVEEIEQVQSKRGSNTVYDEYATYSNFAEFVESLEGGQIDGNRWAKKAKRVTKEGEKQFYKCSSCSKKMFSLKLRTSQDVKVCIEDCLHLHTDGPSKEFWEKSKNRVVEMYQKEGKKPKEISRWLRLHLSEGFVEISQTQITNLIQRVKKHDEPTMTVEMLKNWCDSHNAIPDDLDEVFAVSEFKITPDELTFKIFLTTKRLISFTTKCKHIATDATYKLLWLNFPVLLCGTNDSDNTFHPFGVLLSRYETESEFAYMFRTCKNLSFELYGHDLDPSVLLADAAGEWTFGYNWIKLRKRIVKYSHEDKQLYMCTTSQSTSDITKAQCKEFWTKEDGWQDFDELVEWSSKFIAVKIDSENWESSACSCHYWQKNFKCKHTIGISHFLNLNKFPGLDLAIEGNAKRGRKKKARAALERNSIVPINRQIDNLNQHEVLQEVASTIQIVNYSIVNVSNQNQLVLASSSVAVHDQVENNIQVSEKRKRGRPKKSSNENEQLSKRVRK